MKKNFDTPNFSKFYKQLLEDLVIMAAKEGKDFFSASFDKQGFTNTSFVPWEKTKNPTDYKILTRTGFLKKSIQTFEKSTHRIVFGSDAEYAEIHNEGGILQIPVTKRSKKYFWLMYKVTGNSLWKWMATTKKSHFVIKMPKRQFIGHSETLMRELDKILTTEITERFKNLK